MKCAKCPFGTRSITDDGNITCCSGLQSRNIFDMDSVQLVRRSSLVQFALLGQAPRGGEPPKAAGDRSHTIFRLLFHQLLRPTAPTDFGGVDVPLRIEG